MEAGEMSIEEFNQALLHQWLKNFRCGSARSFLRYTFKLFFLYW